MFTANLGGVNSGPTPGLKKKCSDVRRAPVMVQEGSCRPRAILFFAFLRKGRAALNNVVLRCGLEKTARPRRAARLTGQIFKNFRSVCLSVSRDETRLPGSSFRTKNQRHQADLPRLPFALELRIESEEINNGATCAS